MRRERHQALGTRFVRAAERTLARQGDTLRRHEQSLANLDPQRVLERGYTLLESLDGRALVSVASLQAGQGVVAVLHDGRADLRVEQVMTAPRSLAAQTHSACRPNAAPAGPRVASPLPPALPKGPAASGPAEPDPPLP